MKHEDSFKLHDSVVVNPGVLDPDLHRDIGGWQGRIYDVGESSQDDLIVGIEWDSQTLQQMPPDTFEYFERENLDWGRMYLSAHELSATSPRDSDAQVKQAQAKLFAQYGIHENEDEDYDDEDDDGDIFITEGHLAGLTRQDVQKLADSPAVYQHGIDYLHANNIHQFIAAPTRITAKVYGHYGDYTVKIADVGNGLEMSCTCPYDGLVCKHLVAVLLRYLAMDHTALLDTSIPEVARQALAAMSQSDLLQLLLELAETNDIFRREILAHITIAPQVTAALPRASQQVRALKQQVAQFYDDLELSDDYGYDDYDDHMNHSGTSFTALETTFEIARTMHPLDRMEVYWHVLTCANEMQATYSMDTPQTVEAIRAYAQTVREIAPTHEEKQAYFTALLSLLGWQLAEYDDVVTAVKQAFDLLCDTPDDYRHLIALLQAAGEVRFADWIASYYLQLGEDEQYFRVRQANLVSEDQYLDLADYWQRKGQAEEARKTLEQYVTALHDRLESRQPAFPGGYAYYGVQSDGVLSRLEAQYRAAGDLGNLCRILLMQSRVQGLTLKLYCQIKEIAEPLGAWMEIKPTLLERSGTSLDLLAAIYLYEEEWDAALRVAADPQRYGMTSVKQLVADGVKTQRPNEALALFRQLVQEQIERKERQAYALAARYAAEIKEIYHAMLHDDAAWQCYIADIRKRYANRPALKDELRGL